MALPPDMHDVVSVEETNGSGFWVTVWSPNGDMHLVAYKAERGPAEHTADVLRWVLQDWRDNA